MSYTRAGACATRVAPGPRTRLGRQQCLRGGYQASWYPARVATNITILKYRIEMARRQLVDGSGASDLPERIERMEAEIEAQRVKNRKHSGKRRKLTDAQRQQIRLDRLAKRIAKREASVAYFRFMRDNNPEYYDRLIKNAEIDLLGMRETRKDMRRGDTR